jgi:hypothetical protein
MVPDLRRVVVNAARRFLDDGFEVHAFKLGAFLQVVQVDNISIVVFAVVELQRFLRVVGGQRINSEWQGRQCMFHKVLGVGLEKVRTVKAAIVEIKRLLFRTGNWR